LTTLPLLHVPAMKKFRIETSLNCPPDLVRHHVMTPALLNYVVAGLMKFEPINPPAFPERWSPGTYTVRMRAFHLIPVGWQAVGIELPGETEPWFVRDNGSGSVARVWDHFIFIAPNGDGTRYVDEIRIDAGVLTWPVSIYARLFYLYRQRRWRRLVAENFRPLAAPAATSR
jgi:hypothetical protein